jgi:S1-C subfamily serine protease
MRGIVNKGSASVLLVLAEWMVGAREATANPKVFERALESVAFIVSPRDKDRVSIGSGTLVNAKERIVLTNFHVVDTQNRAVIFFPAYRGNDLITDPKYYLKRAEKLGIIGRVIARSKECDLALIKLASVPAGLHEMRLSARSARPGETLHAVGSSGFGFGTLWRYSKGEVRQVYVKKFRCGEPPIEINARIVETQIPINQGDSGGPVLNGAGELAAVSQSHLDHSVQELVTMMIDISEVRAFLKKQKLLPQPPSKKVAGNTKSR